MFTRRAEEAPALVQTPQPRRERKPMAEAECFKPSTFAARKAKADAAAAALAVPRLVSMGKTERWFKDGTGKDVYVEGELLCDVDHPTRIYLELDGVPGRTPLFETGDGKADTVDPLGTIARSSKPGSAYHASAVEESTRPV